MARVLLLLALAGCGGGDVPPSVNRLGGTIIGLTTDGLVLSLTVGSTEEQLLVHLPADHFTFRSVLAQGAQYAARVKTQPLGLTCSVVNGVGEMPPHSVTDIAVGCGVEVHHVGGKVAGLAAGEHVVLTLNDSEQTVSFGSFTFENAIPFGWTYTVAVKTPPLGEDCTVENGVGSMLHDDITNVGVNCQPIPPARPTLAVSPAGKQLRFSWGSIPTATIYKVYENPDGAAFRQVGGDLVGTEYDLEISVHRFPWASASFRVDACNDAGCTASDAVAVNGYMLETIGVFDPPEHGASTVVDAVAMSADGNTIAIAAIGESTSASDSGAVYVYVKSGSGWVPQGFLKAAAPGTMDMFGTALAISSDGNTLAIGADSEGSGATGIDGSQQDNSMSQAGAVYIFTRSGTTWTQAAYVKSSNTGALDFFGSSLALSAAGDLMAVGAPGEDSAATSVEGSQSDNSASAAGAVYLFDRVGETWAQRAYVKASNTGAGDAFGSAVALSGDGNTLIVGAPKEDSSATGIGGTQANEAAADAGPRTCSPAPVRPGRSRPT